MTPEFPIEKAIKIYTAILTQADTDAPTAKILHNTLGNLVWTRSAIGFYIGTLNGQLPFDKLVIFTGNGASAKYITSTYEATPDTISLFQTNIFTGDPVDEFTDIYVEIRVYNI